MSSAHIIAAIVRAVAGLAALGNMASSIRCGSLQRPLGSLTRPTLLPRRPSRIRRPPYLEAARLMRSRACVSARICWLIIPARRRLAAPSGHHDRSADDLAGVHVGVGLFAVLDRVRRGLDLDLAALNGDVPKTTGTDDRRGRSTDQSRQHARDGLVGVRAASVREAARTGSRSSMGTRWRELSTSMYSAIAPCVARPGEILRSGTGSWCRRHTSRTSRTPQQPYTMTVGREPYAVY